MKLAIIDLEWTAWKGSHERKWSLEFEQKEIVEFGFVSFNNFSSTSIRKKSFYFKTSKEISNYFTKLTNITKRFHEERGKKFEKNFFEISREMSQCKIILCNGKDKDIIVENFKLKKLPLPFFLRKIKDISHVLSNVLNKDGEHQVSSELLDILKIENNVKYKHRASDDAHAIFLALKYLIKKRRVKVSEILR
tara:strand:- start:463 stop:1041 length:579 start_codon:yes stop_codon:yes gene_type:complete